MRNKQTKINAEQLKPIRFQMGDGRWQLGVDYLRYFRWTVAIFNNGCF